MSFMLSLTDIAGLQADALLALNSTCSILRVVRTPDGAGDVTEVWTAASVNVPCSVVANNGNELEQEGRMTMLSPATICVPYGTDVSERDQVQVGTNIYQITSINSDVGSFSLVIPLSGIQVK